MAGDVNLRLRLRRIDFDREQFLADDGVVYQAVVRAAEKAVEYAKQAAPVRSGELKDSLEYRIFKTPSGQIVGDVGPNDEKQSKKALWTNFGTAGPIRPLPPNTVMVLRDGRGPTHQKEVSGQQANPWLVKSIQRVRKQDFEQ